MNDSQIEESFLNILATLRESHGDEYSIEWSNLLHIALSNFPCLHTPTEASRLSQEDHVPYWPLRFVCVLSRMDDKHWVDWVKDHDSNIWWRITPLGLVLIGENITSR